MPKYLLPGVLALLKTTCPAGTSVCGFSVTLGICGFSVTELAFTSSFTVAGIQRWLGKMNCALGTNE